MAEHEHDDGIWRGVGSAPTRSRRAVFYVGERGTREWAAEFSIRWSAAHSRGAHDLEEPRKPRSCAADRRVGVRAARLLPRLKPHASGPDLICERDAAASPVKSPRKIRVFRPAGNAASGTQRKKEAVGNSRSKTCIRLRLTATLEIGRTRSENRDAGTNEKPAF